MDDEPEAPWPQWSSFYDDRRQIAVGNDDVFVAYTAGDVTAPDAVVFVLLHGAGHSAMAWAQVAAAVKSQHPVVAFDYRGHGDTKCKDERDLSADRLVDDAIAVIQATVRPDACIVLAGHSLGGALAIRIASQTDRVRVSGVAVVDVVEGTALPALRYMRGILQRRPQYFKTLQEAVRYAVHSGALATTEAARVSIPSQLTYRQDTGAWHWRTNLLASEPHWQAWFQGLTPLLLGLHDCARLLVLAAADRMDKDILIAQMQGRLQVEIIAGGHSIQEDSWQQLARVLVQFAARNRFVEMRALNDRHRHRP